MQRSIILISILLILPVASAEIAGFGNQPPTIESIGSQYLIVGEPYSFKIKAVDADGNTLTFSDNTDLFEINSSTGEISFIPKEEDTGRHLVTIFVSDSIEISAVTAYFTISSAHLGGRFKLDKSVIKVLSSYGELEIASLTIQNLDSFEAIYLLELHGLENKAYLSADQIQIPAKKSGTITVNFGGIKPGIYTGELIVRSGELKEIIPVVFEVESSEVSVDGKLLLQAYEFKAGQEVIFSITLIDLSDGGVKQVRVYEYIYDLLGNEIHKTYEDINIEAQAIFTKTLSLPNYLKPGEYVAAIKVVNGVSIGTASQIFKVAKEKPEITGIPSIMYIILAIIGAVAILLVYKNREELFKVKKLKAKEIKLRKIERLKHKKAEYLFQLRKINEALELKSIKKKTYKIAKKRINAEIKKINDEIKRKEARL